MHSTSFSAEPSSTRGGDVLVATLVTDGPTQADNNSSASKSNKAPQCDLAESLMHCVNISEPSSVKSETLVSLATLVSESRILSSASSKAKKFYEGPHCTLIKGASKEHQCDYSDPLCIKFENDRKIVQNLSEKNIPLCIEVLLTCQCKEIGEVLTDVNFDDIYVLEQWHFNFCAKRVTDPIFFNLNQLVSAIRSQLYFSQITAWLTTQSETVTEKNFRYHLSAPGKSFINPKFHLTATKHDFPLTDIGSGLILNVSFYSLPRTSKIPNIVCQNCVNRNMELLVDDRMHTACNIKGKHRCEDLEEDDNEVKIETNIKRLCQNGKAPEPSTSKSKPKLKVFIENSSFYGCDKLHLSPIRQASPITSKIDVQKDLKKDKGQLLLEAIERSAQRTPTVEGSDTNCDTSESDIFNIKKNNSFNLKHCDSPIPRVKQKNMRDISNIDLLKRSTVRQKIIFNDFDDCDKSMQLDVPSQMEQAKFRKSLDNAASMVFHARTGLPLTSSPAPVRKGKTCFDFDSSLNSVSAIKSALYPTSYNTDDESESDGSIVSPRSPNTLELQKKEAASPISGLPRRKGHAANLLGSFEESVLNGRLEPVSTVHGFKAELGASGSFVPKHLVVPVTVFFYTLGDNDKVSSPYLSHINLGRKGYNVPKSGTVQVTLFNPLGTVVKMFVIMYDLTDMPSNSQTFIRQRTLYMPANCKDPDLEWGPKWLRYLIHLRFMSSKSGKIYLHSDIRMIIFRKCDMDTATAHGGIDTSYELRSFTHMPANPRFSPRK